VKCSISSNSISPVKEVNKEKFYNLKCFTKSHIVNATKKRGRPKGSKNKSIELKVSKRKKTFENAPTILETGTNAYDVSPDKWSMQNVQDWLDKNGFENCKSEFIKKKITGRILLELSSVQDIKKHLNIDIMYWDDLSRKIEQLKNQSSNLLE